MTTEYVSIPMAVFESPAYAAMARAEKCLLIDLYIEKHDTERFTIEFSPGIRGAAIPRVRTLINAGFLILDESIEFGRGVGLRRVFRFGYPARTS